MKDKAIARLQQTGTIKSSNTKSSSTAQSPAKGGTAMTTRKKGIFFLLCIVLRCKLKQCVLTVARQQGPPSSISSPDMEVPSEETPAQSKCAGQDTGEPFESEHTLSVNVFTVGRAVGEEPHENALPAFDQSASYLKATNTAMGGSPRHPTAAAAGTAAEQKRGRVKARGGGRPPDAKEAAATKPARRSPRTGDSATMAGRKSATTRTPRRKGEQRAQEQQQHAAGAEAAVHGHVQPAQMDVSADFGGYGGGRCVVDDFPQQDAPAPEVEIPVEPPHEFGTLQSLNDSARNAARGKRKFQHSVPLQSMPHTEQEALESPSKQQKGSASKRKVRRGDHLQ